MHTIGFGEPDAALKMGATGTVMLHDGNQSTYSFHLQGIFTVTSQNKAISVFTNMKIKNHESGHA
jgi:hypothetical protein